MNELLKELAKGLKNRELFAEAEQIEHLVSEGYVKVAMLTDDVISEGLRYHIEKNIPLTDPVYRIYTKAYFDLLTEAKLLYKAGKLLVENDSEWLFSDHHGKFATYEGEVVPLDSPMEFDKEEDILKMAAEYQGKKVQIGKPRPLRKGEPSHGRKQYVVYVKDGDKVKRIVFGDPNLKAKPEHAKNRKSFRARHKCDQKKDRTTPGYWSCRYPPNW